MSLLAAIGTVGAIVTALLLERYPHHHGMILVIGIGFILLCIAGLIAVYLRAPKDKKVADEMAKVDDNCPGISAGSAVYLGPQSDNVTVEGIDDYSGKPFTVQSHGSNIKVRRIRTFPTEK